MRGFIISFLISFPICLYADDGFFDRGFVTQKETSKENETPATQKQQPESVKDTKNVLEESSGIKAYSLGLIVNGYDQAHFIKHFQAALRTAAHNDLDISSILAVGLVQEGREAESMPLFKRSAELFSLRMLGGKLYPVDKVPERFKVASSPSWFVNTAKGTILVEGKEEIWEFFNTKGEFVEKGFSQTVNEKSKASPSTN